MGLLCKIFRLTGVCLCGGVGDLNLGRWGEEQLLTGGGDLGGFGLLLTSLLDGLAALGNFSGGFFANIGFLVLVGCGDY